MLLQAAALIFSFISRKNLSSFSVLHKLDILELGDRLVLFLNDKIRTDEFNLGSSMPLKISKALEFARGRQLQQFHKFLRP